MSKKGGQLRKLFDYTKLRRFILYKFGTIQAFAKELGVSKQTVSYSLNGKYNFSQAKIDEWAKVLEIPAEEIGVYFFDKNVQEKEQTENKTE